MNIKKEIIVFTKREIASCGSENNHPKVYIHLKKNEKGVCPYCSKAFIYSQK
jgi:uncharacterized Zn-finger protein